jgi:hypothetical protein
MIMVFTHFMNHPDDNSDFQHIPMPIYGELLSQKDNVYKVDFRIGYKIAKLDAEINEHIQYVDKSLCTHLKEEPR